MEDGDRIFYMAWGIAIVLIGIAAALAYEGFWAYASFVLFGGVGITLLVLSGKEPVRFYGGIGFLLIGILLYAILAGLNAVLTAVLVVIIIGAVVLVHGLRGEKK
ncbi:MAG: hypothetical protein GXO25_01260 [Euryarchaeota archaeon]|nr:hypothetical protein [Euryarchaeota archaeon]